MSGTRLHLTLAISVGAVAAVLLSGLTVEAWAGAPAPIAGSATYSGGTDTFLASGTVRNHFASQPITVNASLNATAFCGNANSYGVSVSTGSASITLSGSQVTVARASGGSASWSTSNPDVSSLFTLSCNATYPTLDYVGLSITSATVTVDSQPPQTLTVV